MAGVEFKKYAMSQAGEMGVHYDNEIRKNEKVKHSNKNINPALTHLNYFIGTENYQKIVQRMEHAVERADEEHPPQRVKKDRKHWFILEAKCPPELEGTSEEDKFYEMTYNLYKKILPLEGAAVHKDEKYEYYDPRKEKIVESRNHIDMFGACITEDGRCNCKALLSPQMCKKVNDEMQKMCLEEWGISYQTGEGRKGKYKTVEQLKQESQVALEAKLAKEGLEVVQEMRQEKADLQGEISELKEIKEANTQHISMQDKQIEASQTVIQNAQEIVKSLKSQEAKIKAANERLLSGIDGMVKSHDGLRRALNVSWKLSDNDRDKITVAMDKTDVRVQKALEQPLDSIDAILAAASVAEQAEKTYSKLKSVAKGDMDLDDGFDLG